jgi:hypothetical protein
MLLDFLNRDVFAEMIETYSTGNNAQAKKKVGVLFDH